MKETHVIFGQRYHSYDPHILEKDVKDVGKKGDVIDDGQPKKVRLGGWDDEKMAENMAANIKKSVPPRSWKIWVESVKVS